MGENALFILGAFHLTKPFENLDTAANGTEFSRKKLSKFPQFEPFNRKILEIPGAKLFDSVFIAPQEHFCMDKGSK